MKSVIFFLLIHVSYITSKTISPRNCTGNVHGDPREKRSDNAEYADEQKDTGNNEEENDDKELTDAINKAIDFALATGSAGIQNDSPKTQQSYKSQQGYNSIKIMSNQNTHSGNTMDIDLETNDNKNENDIQKTVSMEKNPISDINPSNTTNSIVEKFDMSSSNNHIQSHAGIDKKSSVIDVTPDIKSKRSNDIQADSKKNVNKSLQNSSQPNYTDITNIREVREHLLDHLLDYFINIIKEEEQYTETRKRNGKDKMKVEEKLRNYYSPQHIDYVLYPNKSEFNEVDMDYHNGRRKSDGNDLLVKPQKWADDTRHSVKIITLPQYSNITENITSKIPKHDIVAMNSQDIKQQNNDKTISNLQKTNKRNPHLSKGQTQNTNIKVNISINGSKDKKSPIKKAKRPSADVIIAENKTSIAAVETEKPETAAAQFLRENNNKNDIKIKTFNDNYLLRDEVPKMNQTKDEINFNDINAETTDLLTDAPISDGSVKKLKPNADDVTVNEKKNEQDTVNFTKSVVLQQKDCDDETKSKVDEKTFGQDLPKGNCKKNLILQFNINM